MIEDVNNIGEIFKKTLENHRIETNADLWARLDSQLSAQSNIITPKTSILKNLSFVKVAAAASLIVSVALAYNYIYLPLISPIQNQTAKKQLITDKPQINDTLTLNQIENNTDNEVIIKNEIKSPLDNSLKQNDIINPVDKYNNFNNQNSSIANNTSNFQPVQSNPQNTVKPQNNQLVNGTDSSNKNLPTNNNYVNQHINDSDIKQQYTDNSNNEEISDLQIPNIFTPNFDGVNDYFVIKNLDKCSSNQLIITNRAGKVIYEKSNYQNNWDASNIPDGVYYYILKCRYNNNDFAKMGSITIAR